MTTQRQTKSSRFLRFAAPMAVALMGVAGLSGAPASAVQTTTRWTLPISDPQPPPQPWWCHTKECVELSISGCESIGGTSWEVDVWLGTLGDCYLP